MFPLLKAALVLTLFLGPYSFALSSENEAASFAKAIDAINAADYKQSRVLLEKLTTARPKKALYWFNLGNSYFLLGQYPKAIAAYKKVTALNSPLKNPARLYVAKAYRKMNQLKKSKHLLASLRNEELPPNLKTEVLEEIQTIEEIDTTDPTAAILQQGIDAYEAKNYDQARAQFDLYLATKQNPKAFMMRGLTKLRQNHPNQAREDFAHVLESDDLALKDDAQVFLKQIQNHTWDAPVPYWLYLDAAIGTNSNLYENGQSEPVTAASGPQYLVGTGYRFLKKERTSLDLSYQFYEEDFNNAPEAKFLSHAVQGLFNYDHQNWFLQPFVGVQFQELGSSPFLRKQNAGLRIEKSFGPHDVGLGYKYSQNISRSDTYNYLSGPSNLWKLYYTYSEARFDVNLYLALATDAIGDLTYSTGEVLPLANNSRTLGLAIGYYPSELWEVSNLLTYSTRTFQQVSLPGGVGRADQMLANSTKVAYTLSAKLKMYLSEEMVFNKSTLTAGNSADKNFNKFITLLGITWEALP